MVIKKDNHKSFENRAARKSYDSPKLIMYGNIREITQTVGNSGMNDMAGGGPLKTA
jgi:hypothetical protein